MEADDRGKKVPHKQRSVHLKKGRPLIVPFQSPGQTSDPVRIYMREMRNIPLLTREGEILVAKEIERGKEIIIKALSKTRSVHNEILSLEEKLAEDDELIRVVFHSSEDECAKRKLEQKKEILINRKFTITLIKRMENSA